MTAEHDPLVALARLIGADDWAVPAHKSPPGWRVQWPAGYFDRELPPEQVEKAAIALREIVTIARDPTATPELALKQCQALAFAGWLALGGKP